MPWATLATSADMPEEETPLVQAGRSGACLVEEWQLKRTACHTKSGMQTAHQHPEADCEELQHIICDCTVPSSPFLATCSPYNTYDYWRSSVIIPQTRQDLRCSLSTQCFLLQVNGAGSLTP